MIEPDTDQYRQVRATALANRSLLFGRLIDALPYDDLQYLGRVLTRHAVEAGYCEPRKATKGNTLVEWSRLKPPAGQGAGTPSRWACIAAVDLLHEHTGTPDPGNKTFLCCWIFYRLLSLGDIDAVLAEFPSEYRKEVSGLLNRGPVEEPLKVTNDKI